MRSLVLPVLSEGDRVRLEAKVQGLAERATGGAGVPQLPPCDPAGTRAGGDRPPHQLQPQAARGDSLGRGEDTHPQGTTALRRRTTLCVCLVWILC